MKKTIVIILILVTLLIAIAYADFEVVGDLEVMGDLIITSDQSGGPIWAMGSDIIATTGYLTIEAEIMWLDGEICHVPDLRPIADNAYALGGSTKRWNTIWCAENAYYGPTPREYGVSTQYGLNIGGGAIFGTVDANAVLDDLTIAGTFSGTGATDIDYKVEIDGEGTPDTFKWSDDGGSTWDATTVSITGSAQTLNNGVTITFAATTGHTSGDYWTWDMEIRNPIFLQDATGDGIMWVGNDGKVGINTESPATILDVDGTGTFNDISVSGALSAGAITGTSLTLNMTQDYLFTKRAGSLAIQSQTAATPFGMELFTAAGDGTDALDFRLFAKGLPEGITDSEYLTIGYIGNLIPYNFLIHSDATGTGTVRPIILYTGANSGQFTLAITGDNTMSGALDVTGTVTGGSLIASDGTDQIELSVASDDAYLKWNDGSLYLETDEGDNTSTTVIIKGKGTGRGVLRINDQDDAEWVQLAALSGHGYFEMAGASPASFRIQSNAACYVSIFQEATEGETQELQIYGFGTGSGGQEHLDISVEQYAANTAEFYGLGTYLFSSKIAFTQIDGNEYIDSLADGYMDYGATTAHRFNANVEIATTKEINFRDSDISIGSTLFDGILDMSADISIDMFYDNADVGDAVDGQSIYINRRAGEGDDYIRLYVDKDRKGLIGFSGDDDLLQLAANALTVNGAVTTGGDINIGSSGAGDRNLYVHSDTAGKFIRLKALGNYSGLEAATLLTITSTGYINIQSGTGQHQYFDCGGTFSFRDQDDSDAVKVTIASATGIINTVGNYQVDGVQVVTNQQAHIADADAAVAVAVGDPPTKAEFDALVTAYNDLATKFNTLLAQLDADAGHGLLAGAP